MAYRETGTDKLAGPIRHIRIATTLVERFRVLLNSNMDSDADLVVGETQQIYPEIWRHLDDAARELRKLGKNLEAFDHIRRQELGALGITDVDVSTHVDLVSLAFGSLRTQQVKTVTFNVAGYKRAREACNELMRTLPEIDFSAIAKAEDKEIAAAGSLHAANYVGAVKWFAAVGALIVISVLLFKFFMSGDTEVEGPRRERVTATKEELQSRLVVSERQARIVQLRELYKKTCDRVARTQLARELRDDGQPTAASTLETEPCQPVRLTCDKVRELISTRLIAEHNIVRDKSWALTCLGVLLPNENGMTPAFVVMASGRRGVMSEDAEREIVPFLPSPSTQLVNVVDLDDDGGDEVVLAGATMVIVSRIENGAFVDIAGPPLLDGCNAVVTVEADFREGRKGERRRLVLTVPDGVKKHCMAPGRHFFALVDGKLVEVD